MKGLFSLTTMADDDKLHPKARYAVSLIPGGDGDPEVHNPTKVNYQHSLSGVDDDDTDNDDGSNSLGQDIVKDVSVPEEEVVFLGDVVEDRTSTPTPKKKKAKKTSCKKKKSGSPPNASPTSPTLLAEAVGVPLVISGTPSRKINATIPLLSSGSLSSPPAMVQSAISTATALTMPEKGSSKDYNIAEADDSSSKSTSSVQEGDIPLGKINRKLDFDSTVASTNHGKHAAGSSSSSLSRLCCTIGWLTVALIALLTWQVLRDPTLPRRTLVWLQDLPHVSTYKARLAGIQEELAFVQHQLSTAHKDLETTRASLAAANQNYDERVRQAQVAEAKHKTTLQELTEKAQIDLEAARAEAGTLRHQLTEMEKEAETRAQAKVQEQIAELLMQVAFQTTKRKAAELETKQAQAVAQEHDRLVQQLDAEHTQLKHEHDTLRSLYDKQAEELVARHRADRDEWLQQNEYTKDVQPQEDHEQKEGLVRIMEAEEQRLKLDLEQMLKDQEEALARQMDAKRRDMEQNVMKEVQRFRTEQEKKLDEKLAAKIAQEQNDMKNAFSIAKKAGTIGRRVHHAVESLKAKSEQVQDRLFAANSSMVRVPMQSSESVLLKGAFKNGDPRFLSEKLKNATGRLLGYSKERAERVGTIAAKTVTLTVSRVGALSRGMLQPVHQRLAETTLTKQLLLQKDGLAEAGNIMKSVNMQSSEAVLLKGAWKEGDPIVPKVVHRMLKCAMAKFKSSFKSSIIVLQRGIQGSRALSLQIGERTKLLSERGMDKLVMVANSSTALLKNGLEVSRTKLSVTKNSSLVLFKESMQRSRVIGSVVTRKSSEMIAQSMKKLPSGKASAATFLANGVERSRILAGDKMKQFCNMAVEKLSSAAVATRELLKKYIHNCSVIGMKAGQTMKAVVLHGKKTMSPPTDAAKEAWRRASLESHIVLSRIGTSLDEWTETGVKACSRAKKATMKALTKAEQTAVVVRARTYKVLQMGVQRGKEGALELSRQGQEALAASNQSTRAVWKKGKKQLQQVKLQKGLMKAGRFGARRAQETWQLRKKHAKKTVYALGRKLVGMRKSIQAKSIRIVDRVKKRGGRDDQGKSFATDTENVSESGDDDTIPSTVPTEDDSSGATLEDDDTIPFTEEKVTDQVYDAETYSSQGDDPVPPDEEGDYGDLQVDI